MLIVLFGPDTYRRNKKMRAIVAAYEAKHPSSSVGHFDADTTDGADRCRTFMRSLSLFTSYRLGIVHGIPEGAEWRDLLTRAVAETAVTMLVACDERLKKLPKEAQTQEFARLEGRELTAFIRTETEIRGLSLAPDDAWLLAASYEDTWGIVTELDRMALGGASEARGAPPAFFPLVQALKGQSVAGRLRALAFGFVHEEPAKLFNVLAALVPGGAKIRMADYDVAVKSGKLEYEEVLLDFVLS